MNVIAVKNIIPTLIDWAETQTPNYDCWWEFSVGSDNWFSFDFCNVVDWGKATQEKYIGILDCGPFYGHYDSDEVHEYKFLYVANKIVAISFKVGDKSKPKYYWMTNNKRQIQTTLLVIYPSQETITDDCEILTGEISETISDSLYMSFVTIDNELYQFNKVPYWGFLRGKGKKILATNNDGIFEVVGEIEKYEIRFPGIVYNDAWQRADFYLTDGRVIVTKDMISENVKYYMFQKVEI